MIKNMKSTIPIYAIGIVWLMYALIFPMYRITDYLIATGLSLICYRVLRLLIPDISVKIEKSDFSMTGIKEADAILSEGKEMLAELKAVTTQLPEPIQLKTNQMYSIGCEIYDFTSKHPESAHKLKNFNKLYFRETLDILGSYNSIINIENLTDSSSRTKTSEKIDGVIDMMIGSFKKTLESVYEDKALDIRTDIKVLETLLKEEGLSDMNKISFERGDIK